MEGSIANLPIEDIEGIGQHYGEKLRQQEIDNITNLAQVSITDIPTLAKQTGVPLFLLYAAKTRAELALSVSVGSEFKSISEKQIEDIMNMPITELCDLTHQSEDAVSTLKKDISTLLSTLDNKAILSRPLGDILVKPVETEGEVPIEPVETEGEVPIEPVETEGEILIGPVKAIEFYGKDLPSSIVADDDGNLHLFFTRDPFSSISTETIWYAKVNYQPFETAGVYAKCFGVAMPRSGPASVGSGCTASFSAQMARIQLASSVCLAVA